MDRTLYPRLINLPKILKKKSHFLFGARQTGKTSLISQQLPQARTLDLLDTDLRLRLDARPSRLREYCEAKDKLIIIDEIQKIPRLLDEVHLLMNEHKLTFLLTGSSARKLRQEGVNLLGGRARELLLLPLTFGELADDFDLMRAVSFGTVPSICLSDEPTKDLRAYVGTYLEQEIRMEGVVRKLPAFSRFLEIAALCNGSILNYTKIADDAQVAKTTVQEYFQVLRDTLIGSDLEVWRKSKKRKVSSTAKFYFFDVGVARSIAELGPLALAGEQLGQALEAYLHHELRAYSNYNDLPELKYWRTQSGIEVDFILGDSIAIEVKASQHVSNRDLKSLRALKEDSDLKSYFLVCRENLERYVDGISIVPVETFLKRLWSGEIL